MTFPFYSFQCPDSGYPVNVEWNANTQLWNVNPDRDSVPFPVDVETAEWCEKAEKALAEYSDSEYDARFVERVLIRRGADLS